MNIQDNVKKMCKEHESETGKTLMQSRNKRKACVDETGIKRKSHSRYFHEVLRSHSCRNLSFNFILSVSHCKNLSSEMALPCLHVLKLLRFHMENAL